MTVFCGFYSLMRALSLITFSIALALATSPTSMVFGKTFRSAWNKPQSFEVGQDPPTPDVSKRDWPPTVVGAGIFRSPEGRFTISLPQQTHGLSSLSVPTPFGTANGDAYIWSMKEGSYMVGYAESSQPLDTPEATKQFFSTLSEAFKKLAIANSGTVGKEMPLELDKHPGLEQRLDLFTGTLVQRTYVVSNRLYQTVVVVKTAQRVYESVAINVLDTFKLLSESELKAEAAKAVADAEPDPLPQTPVAARQGTDAADEGLHGRVKTVKTESQHLLGEIPAKKVNSLAQYSEQSNLIRQEFYDYKGNLDDITVYGYIDGARVSKFKTISHEYNPPPMLVGLPPDTAKKFDSRYNYRYEFKYDDQKRLVEKTMLHSNGELWLRYVYKYTGSQREELVYAADGSLNQRYLVTLDSKGNEIAETIFQRDGSIRLKESYAYEFDAKGNWVKQTVTRIVIKDGIEQSERDRIRFRTITYY